MTNIPRALVLHLIRVSVIVWIVILLISLIYLGSGRDPYSRTNHLDVHIIDMDQRTAGNYFFSAFHQTPPGNLTLNWIFKQGNYLTRDIIDEVEHGKVWAAVYLNPGITATINQTIDSILQGLPFNSSIYDPSSAVTIVYDEVRSVNGVKGFILPAIEKAIEAASMSYANYIQSRIESHTNSSLESLIATTSASSIIWSPLDYTSMNLHSAFPYARWLSTNLGYLFLWLLMIALVTLNIRITAPFINKLQIIDIAIMRMISTIINSLIITLIFSLCILWFGHLTAADLFIRFWLFNWLCTLTFASIVSLFTLNLGVMTQVVLIIFIILNLSTSGSSLPIELQHRFYRIGYGLPLYHCLSGGRHLLFGSYGTLGLDIGVLIIYYIVCILLTILTGVLQMRKQQSSP